MRTVLLLDFDGVILRNRRVLDYQAHASVEFVSRVTRLRRGVAQALNSRLYPRYGHSVLMVRELLRRPDVTLEQYNDFVFAPDKLAALSAHVDGATRVHAAGFARLLGSRDDVFVFTNSPRAWVDHFARLLGLAVLLDDPGRVLCPDTTAELKPFARAYERAAQLSLAHMGMGGSAPQDPPRGILMGMGGSAPQDPPRGILMGMEGGAPQDPPRRRREDFSKDYAFAFVDDSARNLEYPAAHLAETWTTLVHFTPGMTADSVESALAARAK